MNQLGRTQATAKLAYIRIKKVFQPQLIHWLRDPGQIASTNAENYVLRELQDMSQAIDLTQEQLLWNALRGTSTITYLDGSSSVVNYQFPATSTPTITGWATATPQKIVDDLFTIKRNIQTYGRVMAKDAYCSSTLIQLIFDAFAAKGAAVVNAGAPAGGYTANPGGVAAMGGLLSDRMKDAYYTQSVLPGFAGLNWHPVEEVYTNASGNLTRFVGDGSASNQELFVGNYDENRPWEVKLGKSADDDAPEGMYGKFTKTWKAHDPSSRQVLMELHHLPVVYRPEQFAYVANVT
jgi:hypothetical protein